MKLEEKIKNKKAVIGVIGLGYIGLPLACFFAKAGFKVKGYDLKKEVVEKIRNRECPISEPGFGEIFKKAVENLEAGSDKSMLENADVYIMCVQTPVRDKRADLAHLESALNSISDYLNEDKLLIIESTVPPGTGKKLFSKIKAKVAYCPERIMPGKIVEEFLNGSRIIGSFRQEDSELAKALYEQVIQGSIELTDITTAEIVKVIENTYRNTNIALANEIAMICDELGTNAYKAIELANKHPRVFIHRPGCGVGGDCVPVAPVLLKENSKVNPSVISKSMEINEEMPGYLVNLVLDKLGTNAGNSKVILLGYSYKPDSNDSRNTPSADIYRELSTKVSQVLRFDPFVQDMEIKNMEEFYKACKGADCLVLATGHDIFMEIDLKKAGDLMRTKSIVDGRGFFDSKELKELGFYYNGIGI